MHLVLRQPFETHPDRLSRRFLSAGIDRPSEVSSVNARQALLCVFALAALTLTSCGTLNRAGKDLTIGVATPVLMVYGGAVDGLQSAQNVSEGMGGSAVLQVVACPFTFAYHAFEHGIYGMVHLVDLPMCALYAPVELSTYGPEIKPLDIYQGTWFDAGSAQGTDPESGEMVSGSR